MHRASAVVPPAAETKTGSLRAALFSGSRFTVTKPMVVPGSSAANLRRAAAPLAAIANNFSRGRRLPGKLLFPSLFFHHSGWPAPVPEKTNSQIGHFFGTLGVPLVDPDFPPRVMRPGRRRFVSGGSFKTWFWQSIKQLYLSV